MKNARHTPGPWKIQNNANKQVVYIVDLEDSNLVAQLTHSDGQVFYGRDRQEIKANARLISSAPNMLEALQEAAKTLVLSCLIDKTNTSAKALKIVEEAIKQATGNEKN